MFTPGGVGVRYNHPSATFMVADGTYMQMFEKQLTNHGHITKFSVTEGGEGWEVRVEEDSRLIRRACYTDWHRVERAVLKMTSEASELERSGWRENAER